MHDKVEELRQGLHVRIDRDLPEEPQEEQKRLEPWEIENQARETFLRDLIGFLSDHPYWIMTMGTGSHQQRKGLSREIAKFIFTIPKVSGSSVPNRETRREILKEVRRG